jgi:prophage tail gpP-like protein
VAEAHQIGTGPDAVRLTLGTDTLKIFTSYEIVLSVFDVPGRFALKLGWADTVRDLIKKYPNRTPFKLHIGDVLMMTGLTDARAAPKGKAAECEIRGRDHMAALANDYFGNELSFSEASYFDLTEKVLQLRGMGDWTLSGSNTANRKAITGARVVEIKPARTVEEIVSEVEQQATRTKVVRKTLKAQLTETPLGFLQRQYKRAGLFLWCTGDGNYILSEPNPHQEPLYNLIRERGVRTPATNITEHDWQDDATTRHSKAVVNGRGGGGKAGRHKIQGVYVDTELTALGYTNQIVEEDKDCKTIKAAEFAARRRICEERREGWRLEYTVSGHTALQAGSGSHRVVYAPDTVAMVNDMELGIEGVHYVPTVTYTGTRQNGTQTRLHLMRPTDLAFAEEMEK